MEVEFEVRSKLTASPTRSCAWPYPLQWSFWRQVLGPCPQSPGAWLHSSCVSQMGLSLRQGCVFLSQKGSPKRGEASHSVWNIPSY